jgi:RecB family exonuclease
MTVNGITPPGLEYLSFSRIDRYRSCSLAYRFKYRDKIPPAFMPSALAVGIAWHARAARGLQGLMEGGFPPVEALVQAFVETIDDLDKETAIQWPEKLDRDKAVEQARAMYAAWVAWERPGSRIIAIEQEFDVELAPWLPRVRGRADLLEETATEVVVVDLKTSASRWSEGEVELRADQLVIYKEAFRDLAAELGKPIVAAFEVVTKTKAPSVERFYLREAEGAIDRQVKIATVMVEGVERQVFLPNPSWTCRTCPWRDPCRRW